MLVAANIFQPLITVFEEVLKFFHNHIGIAWGLAIVLLTVLIRAILLPLAIKQFHSMQKLYQEHGVNPFGSCLPLVAQLPVFIALYYMLRTNLRGDICPQEQPGAHMVNGHWVGFSTAHTHACG